MDPITDNDLWDDEEDLIPQSPMPEDIKEFLMSSTNGLSITADTIEWMGIEGLTSYNSIIEFGILSYHDLFMRYHSLIIKARQRDIKRLRSFSLYVKTMEPPARVFTPELLDQASFRLLHNQKVSTMNREFPLWSKKVQAIKESPKEVTNTPGPLRSVFERMPQNSPLSTESYRLLHSDNYGIPVQRQLTQRAKLSDKTTWNGQLGTFDDFKSIFHGHMIQVGAGYCVQKDFLTSYVKLGRHCMDDFPALDITQTQLNHDCAMIYGALLTACRNGVGMKTLTKYCNTQDGLAAWNEFLTLYNNEGSKKLKRVKYEEMIQVRYTHWYPGGQSQFVEDYENAFLQLEQLGCAFTDEIKMTRMLHNMGTIDNQWMINHCETQCKSYEECCQFLREKSITQNYMMGHDRRNIRVAISEDDYNPDESSTQAARKLMYTMMKNRSPSPFSIPRDAWDLLTKQAKEDFMERRKEILRTKSPSRRNSPPPSERDQKLPEKSNEQDKFDKKLPQQYTKPSNEYIKVNGVNTLDSGEHQDEVQSTLELENEETMIRTILNSINLALGPQDNRNGFNTRTLHINMDQEEKVACMASQNIPLMISDGGADTCVLGGKHWHVLSYTNRKVNVIGFDPASARKNNLPIVSACTVVKDKKGKEYLLEVHEAVLNMSSNTTLLSEFQMRHAGCEVDSVATIHSKQGNYGFQGLKIDDVILPFSVRGCLMTLYQRKPNKEDLRVLSQITATLDVPWSPTDHYDEDKSTIYYDVTTVYATNQEDDSHLYYFDPQDNEESIIHHGKTFDMNTTNFDKKIDSTMNIFLETLDQDSITEMGYDLEATANAYRIATATSTKKTLADFENIRPFLGYRPIEVVKHTIENTTQLVKNIVRFPMRRHIRARFPGLNRNRLREKVATDTYFAGITAYGGDTCAQVFFGISSHMINVYGMKSEHEAPNAYRDFLREEGAPLILKRDNSKVQKNAIFTELNRKYLIGDQFTEPHHPQQNPAELRAVKWLKDHSQILLDRTGAPDKAWLLACEYMANVHNICADETISWKTPICKRHGSTPDISAFLIFQFYEKILYLDPEESYPISKEKPGWFVGISENIGDALTFKILTEGTHRVIHRSVVRSANDVNNPNKRVNFDEEVDIISQNMEEPTISIYETPEQDLILKETNHHMIPKETSIDNNNQVETTNITETPLRRSKRTRKPISRLAIKATSHIVKQVDEERRINVFSSYGEERHNNILQPKEAIVHDNTVGETQDSSNYDKKLIRSIMYVNQMDTWKESYENDFDHKTWKAKYILNHEKMNQSKQGMIIMVQVQWSNDEISWVDMKILLLQEPLLMLNYAINKKLWKLPEWDWVNDYLSNEKSVLEVTQRCNTTAQNKQRFKFGEEIARSQKHSLILDQANGNNQWKEATDTELKQISNYNTFTILEPGEATPSGYQRIPYHIIFDVKFDLRKKARLVAGGNWTSPPIEDIYSGVVSLEAIRIGFVIAALNELKVCAGDIGNAFLYGKTKEKVYIIAGPEFGEHQGKRMIIEKGLYGLRSLSARFHEHLSEKLRKMGYTPSKADADLWIKDCGSHNEYLATYVDDILSFSKNPMDVIQELKNDYIMKGVGEPEYYLGGNVETLHESWHQKEIYTALSAQTYVENVTKKIEKMIGSEIRTFKTPMAENYHPENDESPLLDEINHTKFRAMIGSGNWAITLGRIDINYAISSLARFSMAPREGHITAIKRVFGYLKKFPKGKIIIDKNYPDYSNFTITNHDNWKEFYPDAEEELPENLPTIRGKSMTITAFVDADHAHDQVTRRSVTGIIVFLNNTPIKWMSKRQKTVETSTYGSELVAARIATEMIIETRFTIRSLGINIEGPSLLLGDNMSVILNTSVPSSMLKKKHNAIAYHRIREAIAGKIIQFAHVKSENNMADILTKPLGNDSFHKIAGKIMFRTPTEIDAFQPIRIPQS